MEKVSRRLFLKIAVATAAIGGGGKYFLHRVTEPKKGGILGSQTGKAKGIPVVSDVDSHSQCRMRVNVTGGKVVEVRGDPTDPEGKGELTLRGGHIKEFLYKFILFVPLRISFEN